MGVYDLYMLHQKGQLGEDPRCSVADVRGQYQWWVMSETHVLLRYWSSWGGWACKIVDGHSSGAYVCNNIMLIWTWLAWIAPFNIFVFMTYYNEPLKRHYKLFNFSSFKGELTAWNRSSPNWKKNNPLGNCYWQLPTPGARGPQFWWLPKIYHDPSSSNPYTPSPRSNLSF